MQQPCAGRGVDTDAFSDEVGMAADLRESDEEMLMNLPVSSPEKHAKAARVRPGPRRVDAAGESKKGRDFASQVPGRGGLEMRMPPEKTSIFDLPDSDTD